MLLLLGMYISIHIPIYIPFSAFVSLLCSSVLNCYCVVFYIFRFRFRLFASRLMFFDGPLPIRFCGTHLNVPENVIVMCLKRYC